MTEPGRDAMPSTAAGARRDAPNAQTDLKRRLIRAVATSVIAHADELTALDSAIGDGDHGHNMKRGCEAVLEDIEALAAAPWPDLLKGAGTKLVMKVGGASGPLFGTFFMALGKELPTAPSRADLAGNLAAAVAAVKARGKSDVGQKTLLDVLAPLCEAFAGGAGPAAMSEAARQAAEATIPMKAIRGRASFLGERSIGVMDPGARSSSLMIEALCNELGES
jgi:phosphoenolpyruvate---glycerone phosphotransferase subunit DhaL